MKTITNIVKDFIVGDIFHELPTTLTTHPFDFFMDSDVDQTVSVDSTPFGKELGYVVCEEYEWENVRSLRGLMQSKLDDLLRLQILINKECSVDIVIHKDEYTDVDYYNDIKSTTTSKISRNGLIGEYITFKTINLGDM